MATIAGACHTSVRTFKSPISRITSASASYSTSLQSTSRRSTRGSQGQSTPTHRLPAISALARHSSTETSPSSSSNTAPPADVLTWDRFFTLRRKRRYLNLASSVGTTATTVLIAAPILAQQDLDAWTAQIAGVDPLVALGLATMTVAGAGWLCGPTFGNLFFGMWARQKGWAQGIADKERSFYARIKRYRADPASSSPQNPIPDYYGEKIASVKDYRRWLKDQKAFNLKKNKNML